MKPKHTREFDQRLEELVEMARAAQRRAQSYRGFRVGAVALAFNGREYRAFAGINMKPLEDGPKICAEQVAVGGAIASGYGTVIGLVVIGEPQPNEERTLTLHPCWVCRTLLPPLPAISRDTIVVTEQASNGRHRERHTIGDLLKRHGQHSHS
ncbi:MAG: hypothetical protein CO132_02710 [Candidatus Kerfeldbacteria bacterium CG_4_9_14_3_um_filter_45_8]|nr:MAG: hypothetical protein CO132_02710 [Candidatus Kerfeldbacteria bacterium CG_4_9_14_3_um_filter_45_8]